ncbi:cell division protein FtsL [Oenococcus sp.]|uniref:cell division protein FtsL n=1 Tax=Oenococcus sp. TaxID=1979414 RepID=UPI0039E8ABB4
MAENAPSYTYRKVNKQASTLKLVKSRPVVRTYKRARWSLGDFVFVFVVAACVSAVMFASILLSNTTARVDDQLQAANGRIQALRSENDKSKEEINKATSVIALQRFAKQNGMTLNSANVQNINK